MRMIGIAHAVPDILTFVTPVFVDARGKRMVQEVREDRVIAFRPVHTGSEFESILGHVTRNVGDRPLYGFQVSSDTYVLGSHFALGAVLQSLSVPLASSGPHLGLATRSAIVRFIDETPKMARIADDPVMYVRKETVRLTALVVDDSKAFREHTKRVLEDAGMLVWTACDGVDALGVLGAHRPHVILLDVEMPRMGGYDFAKLVRKNEEFASIPIVVVTSCMAAKHHVRARDLGIDQLVNKPYRGRQLLQAIESCVPDALIDDNERRRAYRPILQSRLLTAEGESR